MAICKGCGDQITFIKTRLGRMMPVDGDEESAYYLDMRDTKGAPQKVIVMDGEILREREVHPTTSGCTRVMGRESHFASCPDAIRFRRTGQVNKGRE